MDTTKDNGHNLVRRSKRVLVAYKLSSYRQAIAGVFRSLQPKVEVKAIGPEDLNWEVERFEPDLLVCDRITSMVKCCVPVWVELYSDYGKSSTVCVNGEITIVDDLQLSDILALLDQVRGGPAAQG